jgi:sulfhydrogenase subunit delta
MASATTTPKPAVGIFGLTGCAGCQLAILNCERELLDLVALLDLQEFLMAASNGHGEPQLDLAFVEGAVLSRRDEDTLKRIRSRATCLVALGTCAVWGGVAALDRLFDRDTLVRDVYGKGGARYDTLPARAVHDVVRVDYAIPGCPIEKHEFLAAVANLLNGNPPVVHTVPVCAECRMRENNCLLLERGLPCAGPVTAAGCDARCPTLGAPCVGCRGPVPDANAASAAAVLQHHGLSAEDARRRLEIFGPLPEPAAAGVEER